MSEGDTASRSDLQRPCSPRATPTRLPLARVARRPALLDPGRGPPRGTARAAVDRLIELDPARLRRLQRVGTLAGFAAGAWLGAAEAPPKLVTLGIPPVVISFMMVLGVFLARWSPPALVRGTAAVKDDVRQAPHLIIWAALAGCLWAVANTLTIFAIKDIGLAIAFPLWNANSLLGILWGTLFFNELRDAGSARWLGVLGGAVLMWLLLAGFVWVVGDLFQQYAAKYVGISRGIPLSNTNQLWGLIWGVFVFGELKGGDPTLYWRVIGGSLLMAAGAGAIALATAPGREHRRWQEAGARESARYGVDPAYVAAGMAGEDSRGTDRPTRRGPLDWLIVAGTSAVFVGFAAVARVPALALDWGWAAALLLALVAFLAAGGLALWRATRFG